MRFASEIIGLPVVALDTGDKIETVRDILYDDSSNKVVALLLDSRGSLGLGTIKTIDYYEIKSIGEDAVVVETGNSIKEQDTDMNEPAAESRAHPSAAVKGKKIMTEDGKDLGTIDDLAIDERTGRIKGYQVTGGIFADIYQGKSFVEAPQVISIGKEIVFVPNTTADAMEEKAGGFKGAVQNARDKFKGMQENSMEKGRELKARAASEKTRKDMDAAKQAVQDKAQQAAEHGHDFWENAKEKASDLKDTAMDKVEEARIKAVLGKPASRVILDKNDKAILNAGDSITNRSIERARKEGVLDILLSSASNKEPELTRKKMRA